MKTGSTSVTAAFYRDRLLDLANQFEEDTPQYQQACLAFLNESEIITAAEQIKTTVNQVAQRLEEVTRYLDQNKPDCLNTCGILQGLNQELDSAVAKLNLHVKQRSSYEHLLRENGDAKAE